MGSGRPKNQRHREQLATHRAVIRRYMNGWQARGMLGDDPVWHRYRMLDDEVTEPMTVHERNAIVASVADGIGLMFEVAQQ